MSNESIKHFLRELRGEVPVGKWRPPLDPERKLDLQFKARKLGDAAHSLLDELRSMRRSSTKI